MLVLTVLPAALGCPVVQRQNFPATIHKLTALESGRQYYLYVPSTYHADRQWPLVITCHGTVPYDDANRQIREWAALAERRGFIVAAPKLVGTRGDLPRSPEKQIALQRQDEQAILEIVQRIKASRNVAEDRVFLTGWSAGGYAVLFTGLRNPDVFRALAVRQGNFDARFLGPVMHRLDRHQPILVFFGANDLLKAQAEACIRWLRRQRMNVHRREIAGGHVRRPDVAYGFFRQCVRQYPWIRASFSVGWQGDPMAVRFRARCDPAPLEYRWQFGDGATERGRQVAH
ncbi:MAG: prolyl oligopeptidase family serine peptidase, partial [Phycisphaerae bacterium]